MYYYKAIKEDILNGNYPIGTLFISIDRQTSDSYIQITEEELDRDYRLLRG